MRRIYSILVLIISLLLPLQGLAELVSSPSPQAQHHSEISHGEHCQHQPNQHKSSQQKKQKDCCLSHASQLSSTALLHHSVCFVVPSKATLAIAPICHYVSILIPAPHRPPISTHIA